MEILSAKNTKVMEWSKLKQKKYRDETGLFIIEDEHLIQEGLDAQLIETVLVLKGSKYHGNIETSQAVLDKLSQTVSANQIIAIAHKPKQDMNFNHCILLDGVQDPGNVGTIIRTAYSFGYNGVILSTNCADEYSSKVIRGSQGAIFRIPVIRMNMNEAIDKIKQNGSMVYATTLINACKMEDIENTHDASLVFGNEGQGVSKEVIAQCDKSIYIDMKNFESLNVAIAMGIASYYFR